MQEVTVRALLRGKDALKVLLTGNGKSLVYQKIHLCLRVYKLEGQIK